MPAYLIVEIRTVHDEPAYAAYRAQVSPGLERAGGRYLVRGGRTAVLEGPWTPPRLVLVEFPSCGAACAAWRSPALASLVTLLRAATTTHVVAVEGLADGAGL